jgi:serine/threonine protein kinase
MVESGKAISEFYKLEENLGQGSFATVRRATNKRTGEKVAIKIISK